MKNSIYKLIIIVIAFLESFNGTEYGCMYLLDSEMSCFSYLIDSNFKYFKDVNEKNCHTNVETCEIKTYTPNDINNSDQQKYLRVSFEQAVLPKIPDKFFVDFSNILYLCIDRSTLQSLEAEDFKNAKNLIVLKIFSHSVTSLTSNFFKFAPNLKEIAITRGYLTTVDKDTLSDLNDLRALDLNKNFIELIPNELLKGKSLLTDLLLQENKIQSINDFVFKDLQSLKRLQLEDNQLAVINENAFKNLRNLVYLGLQRSKISMLKKNTFHSLEMLIELDLTINQLTEVHPELFQNLTSLKMLNLRSNNIANLPEGIFKNNLQLENLDLSSNNIKYIHQSTFEGLNQLRELDLYKNQIEKVSAKAFTSLDSLKLLNLPNNICVDRFWGYWGIANAGNEPIVRSELQNFFASSDCAICLVPQVNNGDIVSVLFGDAFEEYARKFQTARIRCHPGYSYLNENGDDVATCDGDNFNMEFPECIKLCPGNETIDYTTQTKCFLNETAVLCNRDQAPGTTAQINCGVGYNLPENSTGSKLLTCLEGGKWNLEPIKCKPICGRLTAKSVAYVIGGQDAQITDIPWAAGIYQLVKRKLINICSGTILTKKIVLSASHCFFNEKVKRFNNIDQYRVTVGKYFNDYDAPESFAPQKFNLSEIRSVSGYKGYEGFFISDFSILILEGTIDFQPHVVPICINLNIRYGSQRVVPAGDIGLVAGWGFTESDGMASNTLKSIKMPVIAFQQCKRESGEFERFVTSDKFCGGYLNGSGICRGDSGAGLTFSQIEDGQEVYYIKGVVSNTRQAAQGGCDKWYTLFTNVLEFLPNIRDAVDEYP